MMRNAGHAKRRFELAMPFYEYECSACKFYVEALQKISDPPMKKCPSCKKPTLKKLVSAPSFRLAGGGWYETDFKSDKENKRNLAGEEKESASAEGKSDDKTDKGDKAADAKPVTDTKAPKAEPAAKKKSSVKTKSKAKVPAKKK
jgi:putative FmdB family regulatory protein